MIYLLYTDDRYTSGPPVTGLALCGLCGKCSISKPEPANPLWRLAEALGNTSESRALIGCFQVLIIIQTVGLFSDSNIVL